MEMEESIAAGAMFSVLSQLIFAEPEDATIISMAEDDLFADAPYGGDDPDVRKGFELVRGWLKANIADAEDPKKALEELRRDWLQLIAGVGVPKAPSWAGFYLSTTGATVSEETLGVRRLYRRYGFELARPNCEPDDHLGIMMGFIGYLIGEELSGNDTVADQLWLLEDRILPWMPAWLYSMDKYAKTDYFRGLGYAIFGLCSRYATRFDIQYNAEEKAYFRKQAEE